MGSAQLTDLLDRVYVDDSPDNVRQVLLKIIQHLIDEQEKLEGIRK